MSLLKDLKLKYYTATIVERLIAINVVVFVLFFLLKTIAFLFKLPEDFADEWFVFPKEIEAYVYKPWTIITYAFMHSGLWHLLMNMMILYFSGRIFMTYFSGKRIITVYMLGAIMGALVYMLSYNLFPVFSNIGASVLIGASASVMAIFLVVATYAPNLSVRMFFLGNIKLWWIAAFFVISDVVQIPMGNAGGHLAHLGGALFGYMYATQLQKGNDIGSGFEKFAKSFLGLFSSSKKSPLKTVHKSKPKQARQNSTSAKSASDSPSVNRIKKNEQQQKIDAILDKISKSGYESLTKGEKDFLFRVGKE